MAYRSWLRYDFILAPPGESSGRSFSGWKRKHANGSRCRRARSVAHHTPGVPGGRGKRRQLRHRNRCSSASCTGGVSGLDSRTGNGPDHSVPCCPRSRTETACLKNNNSNDPNRQRDPDEPDLFFVLVIHALIATSVRASSDRAALRRSFPSAHNRKPGSIAQTGLATKVSSARQAQRRPRHRSGNA